MFSVQGVALETEKRFAGFRYQTPDEISSSKIFLKSKMQEMITLVLA
jgi:hypothetical protein